MLYNKLFLLYDKFFLLYDKLFLLYIKGDIPFISTLYYQKNFSKHVNMFKKTHLCPLNNVKSSVFSCDR